ncbi:serpin family protein [Marinactinospora thermotolerans]|uniref:Serpin B n=1 Tax=Marinactinospora thermotolerans DSM 45154 TaxID=1122192 RepID=A0A1T4S665_9ACTN|nr:serpin family protein [Marinactinospora thermotolerans]SKA23657.1 serpin B [Marinactinospora thermotolerans DSM 45154]
MPNAPRPDHLAFATRLDAALSSPGEAGLVWSPHSVGSALGLLALGARGDTRAELVGLLGEDLAGHLAELDRAAEADSDLATATALWVDRRLPIEPAFEAELRSRPGAAVHPADFAHDAEGARRAANAEVAKVTRGLISELLAPGTVSPATRALLVNALWVRLRWREPFDPGQTAPRRFASPRGPREVAMMRRSTTLPYARTHGWHMVTLTADHDLALDVLLPEQDSPAPAPPSAATLRALYRASSRVEVDLSLPRFELTWRADLATALAEAGAPTMFSDRADFGGVSAQPLRIDAVVHQARLRVDEKGAEGAAATAVVMRLASFTPRRPVTFTVDRPFVFALRRGATVLFLGRVTDPLDPGPAK